MKVKRFLAVVSFSILISLYIVLSMPRNIFNVSLALFAIFIIIHRSTVNRYTCEMIVSFISIIIAISYLNIYNFHLSNKISQFDNLDNIVRTGVVTDKKQQSSPIQYTIKIKTIDDNKTNNFSVVITTDDVLKVGDYVTLTGKYKSFMNNNNRNYYYSKAIFGKFSCDNIELENSTTNINNIIGEFKRNILSKIRKIYNFNYVPVVAAMSIGDKSLVNSDTVNQFNFTGISHTLVVSGLHVGIIASAISIILSLIPIKKTYKNIVTSIIVFMFMLLVGFTSSIIRAGIIYITILIGRSCVLEIDNFTTMAIIIIITIIMNPYSAVNASLLLSYSAYFGVIYRLKIIDKKEYGYITGTLLISFMAVVFTLPIMTMLGMKITLFSPIFNFFIAPIISIICVLSFFTPLLSFIPGISILTNLVLVPLNEFCIFILLNFTEFISKNFEFALIDISQENIKFMIWIVLVCCAIAAVQFSNKKISAFFIVLVPLASFLCYNYIDKDIITVKAFANGREPSFEISYNKDNYLILSGNINEKRISSIVQKYDISNFTQIILCCREEQDTSYLAQYSDEIISLDSTDMFLNDILQLRSNIEETSSKYTINIENVNISFSYGDAEIDNSDFYFMGLDKPVKTESKNNYYFYSRYNDNEKTHKYSNMVELYDVFTIKIKNGEYHIIKDVKNFGYQL